MESKQLGIQLKKARMESGLSQAELGKRIGVTWEMISRYENAKSSPRKNLEAIAKELKKPIQYFFGVEELPIRDEIKRLTALLEKREEDPQKRFGVPLVETLGEYSLTQALEYTKQFYGAPTWIASRFKGVFALRLDEVDSDVVSIGAGDTAFFARSLLAKPSDFVLLVEDGKMSIVKYVKSMRRAYFAVLVAVEKRYYK